MARVRNGPILTREKIAAVALERLEAGGLARISMRELAQHFGVWPNAIYEYFPSKNALLAAVVDLVLDGDELPPDDEPWQRRLYLSACDFWTRLQPYPDLAVFLLRRVGFTGTLRSRNREVVAMLFENGFDAEDAALTMLSLNTYMLGAVSIFHGDSTPAQRIVSGRGDAAGRVHEESRFDRQEMSRVYSELTREQQFLFGLERLIDGFASHQATRLRGGSPSSFTTSRREDRAPL